MFMQDTPWAPWAGQVLRAESGLEPTHSRTPSRVPPRGGGGQLCGWTVDARPAELWGPWPHMQ